MKKVVRLLKKCWNYGRQCLIDNIISKIFLLFPVQKRIMFESLPDIGDSTKEVYEEMLRRGINEEYEFLWYLHRRTENLPSVKNVKFLTGKNRLLFLYYEYTSACLISSNMFLLSHSKRQKSFSISHGSTIKSLVGYYYLPKKVDYYISASEDSGRILAKMMNIPPQKEAYLGLPRNDEFSRPQKDIHGLFTTDYNKIIVWYPTYRQHRSGGHNTGAKRAIPILHNADSARQLNEVAKSCNVLFVIKPHFAQDVKYISELELSNIKFINDQFLEARNINSYELVHAADALISDYSSIYFDYLLTDKPVALVWEDIEEYRRNPGFGVDISYYCKGATKVYTLSDLEAFVHELKRGIDLLKEERKEICTLVNYSDDGKNTKRVVDFICKNTKQLNKYVR